MSKPGQILPDSRKGIDADEPAIRSLALRGLSVPHMKATEQIIACFPVRQLSV